MLALTNINVKLGSRNILQGVSATFLPGLHYIVGLNGSGKSTLLRCMAGLIPYSGLIELDGKELRQFSPRSLSKQIAVVHQLNQLAFRVQVFAFVLMGRYPYLSWLGAYHQEDREIAQAQLERLGIGALAARHLDEISGGELQKVFIARALCQDTPFLLLDEPAQSLDPLNKRQLYHLLETLASQGHTVICSTHDLEPVANPHASVWGIRQGQLVLHTTQGAGEARLMDEVFCP